ncbi:hypothetical protein [Dyella sp.]|uniref:hypothetical protein n=1 Tax=Dyella sp. TaxID=1869338 RepID=UPI002ED581C0
MTKTKGASRGSAPSPQQAAIAEPAIAKADALRLARALRGKLDELPCNAMGMSFHPATLARMNPRAPYTPGELRAFYKYFSAVERASSPLNHPASRPRQYIHESCRMLKWHFRACVSDAIRGSMQRKWLSANQGPEGVSDSRFAHQRMATPASRRVTSDDPGSHRGLPARQTEHPVSFITVRPAVHQLLAPKHMQRMNKVAAHHARDVHRAQISAPYLNDRLRQLGLAPIHYQFANWIRIGPSDIHEEWFATVRLPAQVGFPDIAGLGFSLMSIRRLGCALQELDLLALHETHPSLVRAALADTASPYRSAGGLRRAMLEHVDRCSMEETRAVLLRKAPHREALHRRTCSLLENYVQLLSAGRLSTSQAQDIRKVIDENEAILRPNAHRKVLQASLCQTSTSFSVQALPVPPGGNAYFELIRVSEHPVEYLRGSFLTIELDGLLNTREGFDQIARAVSEKTSSQFAQTVSDILADAARHGSNSRFTTALGITQRLRYKFKDGRPYLLKSDVLKSIANRPDFAKTDLVHESVDTAARGAQLVCEVLGADSLDYILSTSHADPRAAPTHAWWNVLAESKRENADRIMRAVAHPRPGSNMNKEVRHIEYVAPETVAHRRALQRAMRASDMPTAELAFKGFLGAYILHCAQQEFRFWSIRPPSHTQPAARHLVNEVNEDHGQPCAYP